MQHILTIPYVAVYPTVCASPDIRFFNLQTISYVAVSIPYAPVQTKVFLKLKTIGY